MSRFRLITLLLLCIPVFLAGCVLPELESELESDNTQPSSRNYPTNSGELTKKQLIEIISDYVEIENTEAIDLGDFTEEFEVNSVVAEEKYMNKDIKLKGKVDSIDNDISGSINVVLKKPYEAPYSFSLDSVTCDGVSRRTAKLMRKGDLVTVYGHVTSTELGVGLNWCYFSEVAEMDPSEAINRLSSEKQ